ncbi:MAG: potassium transporter TrkG [Clostridiales bacterium]|nr:potassium transporter TrkG [Clostridiales bacterium]
MKRKIRITTPQLFACGFALIILLGAAALALPFASRDGHSIPFLNALFTACSATCVTGLSVYDVWTQFSGFGQAVLLLLIQLGGLGFMSFAALIALAAGRRIGLKERMELSDAIASGQLGGVVRMVRLALTGTFVLEGAGAVLLAIRFVPLFGFWEGLWYSVFHAVSAFCNAGFDLMGQLTPGQSLAYFVGDPLVNCTVMALILAGGLGFLVWNDIYENGLHVRRYLLHSKLVLSFSIVLIVVPAVLFFITERSAAFAGLSAGDRVLAALFSAVTPRTAGFSTVDTASLSGAGTVLTQTLMAIGAGSGSTGGGIKVSTFAVMALAVLSHMRGHKDVQIWGERVDAPLVRSAFCNTLLFLGMALAGTFLVLAFQPLPLTDAAFECLSAIGTVGMSTGVTASLETGPKLVLILLMYAGRIGSITVFLAFIRPRRSGKTRCPVGKVVIG